MAENFPINFGLYDMYSNVYEWCQDFYDSEYYNVSPNLDPTGSFSGRNHALRGGCIYSTTIMFRSAHRIGHHTATDWFGFRSIMLPKPTPKPPAEE